MTSRVVGRLSQRPIKDATVRSTVDHYISHCTYCLRGIFSNHFYEWQGGDGLVHIKCDDPRGTDAIKRAT
jgi:hypothetical protein